MKLNKGMRALVTGASSGIGLAFAEALAARGLDLALVARSGDKLNELAAALAKTHGVVVEVVVADLSAPGASAQVHAALAAKGWSIDLMVNNAGFGRWGAFLDHGAEAYSSMIRLNIDAVVELTQLYLPAMLARGAGGVINVGSTASLVPVPFAGVYGATKAFVLSFTEALHGEYGDQGVHAMTLCPGGTDTQFAKVALDGRPSNRQSFGVAPALVVSEALAAFEAGKTYVVSPKASRFTFTALPRLLTRKTVIGLVASQFRKVAGK